MSIKKIAITTAIVFILISIASCTVRSCTALITDIFPRQKRIVLLPNQKLVTISWKGEYIWCLTRPMTPDDKVEVYKFQEEPQKWNSEGTIEIVEQKGDSDAVHQTGEQTQVQR